MNLFYYICNMIFLVVFDILFWYGYGVIGIMMMWGLLGGRYVSNSKIFCSEKSIRIV